MQSILLAKPEQSGKTFKMIELLQSQIKNDDGSKNVNIIMADNNLLSARQTLERLEQKKMESIEFSSSSSATSNTLYDALGRICIILLKKNIVNLICCDNFIRNQDVVQIICGLPDICTNINIWIDEGDKYQNLTEKYIKQKLRKLQISKKVNITYITATPQQILDTQSDINVIPLKNPIDKEYYHGWNDNTIIHIEEEKEIMINAKYILTKYKNMFVSNTVWFIPSNIDKASHISMKDMCIEKGANVLIINGDGCLLYKTSELYKNYRKSKGTETLLLEIYKNNNLNAKPFVITGRNCITRGNTLSSPELSITHSIMPHNSKGDSASQLAGRTKGNMKKWRSYDSNPHIVFCTKDFDDIVKKKEKKCIELGKDAYENKLYKHFNTSKIIKKKIKQVLKINIKMEKYKGSDFYHAKKCIEKYTGAKGIWDLHKRNKITVNGKVMYRATISFIPEYHKLSIIEFSVLKKNIEKIKTRIENRIYTQSLYPVYYDIDDPETLIWVYFRKV